MKVHFMTDHEAGTMVHDGPYKTHCGRLLPRDRVRVVSLRQQAEVDCRPCLYSALHEVREEANYWHGTARLLFKRC